jgi:hypothetical protein
MSFCSSFLDLLFVFIFSIRFFYSFFTFAWAFAVIFIILKIIRFLTSWSDIARPFYVSKEFNFSYSEDRVIPDLSFFFKIFILHEFRR